ncbi:DUF4435 domain-containing protein [Bacillus cereus]|uniref:DUF4435 domain-containing protein n=1 Tax=Bacillus cereus TaxID=1396 RepID=UPI002ABFE831|nr:DUF4435 domain-containing protein [Bacillus cereus]MDZ4468034.1 hypothetical protein [Bacillus cereus]MDZ4527773.1 hypothetical protein [Bacillus cereus]
MSIEQGASFNMTIGELANSITVFGMEDTDPVLLVEGKDDINLINRYYYLSEKNLNFRLVTGIDPDAAVAGKRNALKALEKYGNIFNNILCLVDRDLDFFLMSNSQDEKVIYYDYYELENYFFDKEILKLFFTHVFDCANNEKFEELVKILINNQEMFIPLFVLKLYVELHYQEKVTSSYPEEICSTIVRLSKNIDGYLSHKKYTDLTYNEKLLALVTDELAKLSINYSDIYQEVDQHIITSMNATQKENLYMFKHCLDGKELVKSMNNICRFIIKEGNFSSFKSSITDTLLREWIPLHSNNFKNIMNTVERKLELSESVV